MPIIVSVVINAVIAVIDAPLSSIDAASGNESNAGICIRAPTTPIRKHHLCLIVLQQIVKFVRVAQNQEVGQ